MPLSCHITAHVEDGYSGDSAEVTVLFRLFAVAGGRGRGPAITKALYAKETGSENVWIPPVGGIVMVEARGAIAA